MAIKIEEKSTEIPVVIGDLEFVFSDTDENRANVRKELFALKEEMENIDDDDEIQNAKDIVKRAYDVILGEGAFDKLYKKTPSVDRLVNYLFQIIEGLEKEVGDILNFKSQSEKAKKYIGKK